MNYTIVSAAHINTTCIKIHDNTLYILPYPYIEYLPYNGEIFEINGIEFKQYSISGLLEVDIFDTPTDMEIDSWIPFLNTLSSIIPFNKLYCKYVTNNLMYNLPSSISTILIDDMNIIDTISDYLTDTEDFMRYPIRIQYTGKRTRISPILDNININIEHMDIPLRHNIGKLLTNNTHLKSIGIDAEYIRVNELRNDNVYITLWVTSDQSEKVAKYIISRTPNKIIRW